MLKVYALLMRDVLPSRANNSANDQDSVQLLKWSEQITVEFVTKKAVSSALAFDQVYTTVFSAMCLGETRKSDSA